MFQKMNSEMAPETPSFQSNKMDSWASSLQSVMDNYTVFLELWEEAIHKLIITDPENSNRMADAII